MKLRRPEFKRKRRYKRRERQRHRISRLFKNLYSDMRFRLFPIATPFVAMRTAEKKVVWGGSGMYFDIVGSEASPEAGAVTTRATMSEEVGHSRDGRTAVPVNYAVSPRDPSSPHG